MGEQEKKTAEQNAFDQACAEWRVVQQGANQSAVYVEAEAGTGSRYAVVVSRLPFAGAMREGGRHLISLLQPWQSNVVFSVFPGEEIHLDYLVEKLVPRTRGITSGGDLAGMWKTVNQAVQLFHDATGYAESQADAARMREAGL